MTVSEDLEIKTTEPVKVDLLAPKDVRRLGQAIGSETYWQADVARQVGYSKSTMTRFLNESRPTNVLLANGFRATMIEKLELLSQLLSVKGMPFAKSENTRKAQALFEEGLELLRGETPEISAEAVVLFGEQAEA